MIIMLIMAGLIALAVNIIRGATGGEGDYLNVQVSLQQFRFLLLLRS